MAWNAFSGSQIARPGHNGKPIHSCKAAIRKVFEIFPRQVAAAAASQQFDLYSIHYSTPQPAPHTISYKIVSHQLPERTTKVSWASEQPVWIIRQFVCLFLLCFSFIFGPHSLAIWGPILVAPDHQNKQHLRSPSSATAGSRSRWRWRWRRLLHILRQLK